jgi:ubiquinone/menaquinone biosynthesis C-methylase UbiE
MGLRISFSIKKNYSRKFKIKKNIKILDAGCGTGYVAEALIELKFKNIVGIDFSKPCWKLQRKKNL